MLLFIELLKATRPLQRPIILLMGAPPITDIPLLDKHPISLTVPTEPPSMPPAKPEERQICGFPAEHVRAMQPSKHWLRSQTPEDMALRIEHLLKQKYVACNGNRSYANCFGTVLWVAGIDPAPMPRNYGEWGDGEWDACDDDLNITASQGHDADENLVRLLETAGYRHAGSQRTFEKPPWVIEGERAIPPAVQPLLEMSSLKNGDILLFGGSEDPRQAFGHAAVFVGMVNGYPVMFEKQSYHCGPESPFHLMRVEDWIREQAQFYMQGAGDTSNYLHVYRRI